MEQRLVTEFARLAGENLARLEADGAPAEVAQLTVTLLGLLAVPPQGFFASVPAVPLSALAEEGLPPLADASDLGVETLDTLLKHLRTAAGYSNLELISGAEGELAGLRVWNQRNRQRTWEAELPVERLRSLVTLLAALLERPEEPAAADADS